MSKVAVTEEMASKKMIVLCGIADHTECQTSYTLKLNGQGLEFIRLCYVSS